MAIHPRPTVLEGFIPDLYCQTWKFPTFTVLLKEARSTKISPFLTVNILPPPYGEPTNDPVDCH